jgi:hypothetical protein
MRVSFHLNKDYTQSFKMFHKHGATSNSARIAVFRCGNTQQHDMCLGSIHWCCQASNFLSSTQPGIQGCAGLQVTHSCHMHYEETIKSYCVVQ